MKLDVELTEEEWVMMQLMLGYGLALFEKETPFEGSAEKALQVINKINANNPDYVPYKNLNDAHRLRHLKILFGKEQ